MDKLDVIRLRFSTPLHIGTEREDYATGNIVFHSDALTAAIFFAWNKLGHPEWIPSNAGEDAGFVISSLFPFFQLSEKNIYFIPRPLITVENQELITDTVLRKKLKKVEWVDVGLFQLLCKGKTSSVKKENLLGTFQSEMAIDTLRTSSGSVPISSEVYPRSAVSRTGEEDTRIFYIERHYFREDAGMYCMIQYTDADAKKKVEAAFRLLADEGIGTDRNIGNGKFVPEFGDTLSFEGIDQANRSINLGLYCPESQETLRDTINDSQCSYDLIRRSGWLSEPYNSWRKKSVYMFREGSVFSNKKADRSVDIRGAIVDVRPDTVEPAIEHPIWRSGRSIFVSCK